LSDHRTAQSWSAFDDAQSAPGGVVARGARWSESALPAATPALMASWAIHAHYGLRGWGALDGVPQGVLVPQLAAGSPVSVVWGDEDATCDPAAAEVLCEALRAAGLDVQQAAVSGAGHRMSEPRLASALARAAQGWVAELRSADSF
jgi:proline iminopeptidase